MSSKIAAAVTEERWITSSTATITPYHDKNTNSSHANIANSTMPNGTTNNNISTGGGGLLAVHHPGVVRLHRCFCAQRAVFFVHSYIPGARSLRERAFIGGGDGRGGGLSMAAAAAPVPEPMLWSAVSQLVLAIRAIHLAKLAVRCLSAQHGLFNNVVSTISNKTTTPNGLGSGHWQLRINCVGVINALEFEACKNILDLQWEDICDLGHLILTLAMGTKISRAVDA